MKTTIAHTVGDLRNALARLPDDCKLVVGMAVIAPDDHEAARGQEVDVKKPDIQDYREAREDAHLPHSQTAPSDTAQSLGTLRKAIVCAEGENAMRASHGLL